MVYPREKHDHSIAVEACVSLFCDLIGQDNPSNIYEVKGVSDDELTNFVFQISYLHRMDIALWEFLCTDRDPFRKHPFIICNIITIAILYRGDFSLSRSISHGFSPFWAPDLESVANTNSPKKSPLEVMSQGAYFHELENRSRYPPPLNRPKLK